MSSLNQCNFVGNLGKDPEVRFTPSGKAVANFSLAVTDKYNGEETTEWVNITLWGKLAEVAGSYLSKGKQVFISGRMQTRKWQDKDGKDRYTTEIVGEKIVMLGKSEGRPQNNQVADTVDDDGQIPF